ncbi:hypothetical protein [Bosea sp. LC85]|uniref:hypothetical protein n=1 Tax=Bosea sp. LC85 TaxID=1502851 RepID=UPI001378BF90|nr:hypothetical protein [Bosea sp. LC85]
MDFIELRPDALSFFVINATRSRVAAAKKREPLQARAGGQAARQGRAFPIKSPESVKNALSRVLEFTSRRAFLRNCSISSSPAQRLDTSVPLQIVQS